MSHNQHKEPEVFVQILHTTDVHGRFINYDYGLDRTIVAGSLAAAATKINQLRTEYEHTYLIDTGDTFQGNYNEIFQHQQNINPMIKIMNMLGYDSFTLGNHEFNHGISMIYNIQKALHAPLLAANIYNSAGQRIGLPYIILQKGDVRIAIVGMVTPNIIRWDANHLSDTKVVMPLQEMENLWPELEGRADCYIFANHLPLHDVYQVGDGYEQLIEHYPQFKVILLSHSHQRRAFVKNKVAYIQPGSYASDLGRVILHFHLNAQDKYELVDMKVSVIDLSGVPEDVRAQAEATVGHRLLVKEMRKPVGRLVGGDMIPQSFLRLMSVAQLQPTALIAFINDVQRFYSGADVSATTLSHIDANLHEGEINRSDVYNIYKYNNGLRLYRMRGKHLRALLEWSARYFNQWREGDLTLSFTGSVPVYDYIMVGGVYYEINVSKAAGERIENLRWPSGSCVQDQEWLSIAMDDFRAKSLVDNDLFKLEQEVVLLRDFTDNDGDYGQVRNLLIRYIQQQPQEIITNNINLKENSFKLTGYHWPKQLHDEAVRQLNEGIIPVSSSANGLSYHTKAVRKKDLKAK